MKKLLVLTLLTVITSLNAQTVKQIRNNVAEINGFKNYKIKTLDPSYFDEKNQVTDNGQELTGYYKAENLKKIVHWIGLSSKKIINEYYFENGSLIFVSSSEFQILDDKGYLLKPKLISTDRYYYHQKKLINANKDDKKQGLEFLSQSKILQKDLGTMQ